MDVSLGAASLVEHAIRVGLVAEQDRTWAYNQVLEGVGTWGPAAPWDEAVAVEIDFDIDAVLGVLAEEAVAAGVVEDSATGRDRAMMRAAGVVTPRPSEVATRFGQLFSEQGPQVATDYLYRLSCDVDYVRRSAIARNLAWSTSTRWGDLQITINKSKPEKDPRDIAAAGAAPTGDVYPACQLCMENEAYSGRPAAAPHGTHPARQNLRIVPIELGGERWGLQYSPYAYYAEHCIAMSSEHRPMHVDRASMTCLLDFVDLFPHYFIGSNADLPVVGGSILSHDHFQGGRHTFPMTVAAIDEKFELPGYPGVSAGVLVWPLTVLRLSSSSREELLAAAVHVLDAWRAWSDPTVGILARTDGVPHNTITPICRRDGGRYVLDLALRCNIASDEHPLGVFHPHEDLHHIKKENIGLIEVMGLAILPARLEAELAAVRAHLLDGTSLEDDPLSAPHAEWARGVAVRHPELTAENANEVLRDEVGCVFGLVLEDAGVYKWDDAGRAALDRFLASL